MRNKKSNQWWSKVLFGSLLIIVLLSVISSVMSLGDRLGNLNEVVKYIFYGLIALVICGGIILTACTERTARQGKNGAGFS